MEVEVGEREKGVKERERENEYNMIFTLLFL